MILIAAVVSCKSKKTLVVHKSADSASTPTSNIVENKLDQIRSAQLNFNTFSGKARAKISINGNSNDVTLTIRISNNKKIWVSVTAIAGIEVARAMITPDSLLVINRLQGIYLKKPFAYIYKYTGRQVNYKTVESLLTGNVIPDLLRDDDQLQPDNGNINITGNMDELAFKLIISPDLKENSANLANPTLGQSLQVSNTQYMLSGNKAVPSQIDIASAAKNQQVHINLHYIKVDFDLPQDFPFTIPDRYTPQD